MGYYDNLKPKKTKKEIEYITDFSKWVDVFNNTRVKLNSQKEVTYNLMLPLNESLLGDDDTSSNAVTELKIKINNNWILRDMRIGQEVLMILEDMKQLVNLQNVYFTHLEEYMRGFILLCESSKIMVTDLNIQLDERDEIIRELRENEGPDPKVPANQPLTEERKKWLIEIYEKCNTMVEYIGLFNTRTRMGRMMSELDKAFLKIYNSSENGAFSGEHIKDIRKNNGVREDRLGIVHENQPEEIPVSPESNSENSLNNTEGAPNE